ncbi:hypothetical protein Tco_0711585 [Tanacetum coccineum]
MEITSVTLVRNKCPRGKGPSTSSLAWLELVLSLVENLMEELRVVRLTRGNKEVFGVQVAYKEVMEVVARLLGVVVVSGLMAYFVTILTPDSARSCVMQCTLPIQGIRSIISTVSISPEGFLPSILLLVVIIVTVVIVVVTVILVDVVVAIIGVVIVVMIIGVVVIVMIIGVVVVVSSIIKLPFVIIGSLLSIVLCYLIH